MKFAYLISMWQPFPYLNYVSGCLRALYILGWNLHAYLLPLHILVFRNLLRIQGFQARAGFCGCECLLTEAGSEEKLGTVLLLLILLQIKNTRKELQAS